MAGMKIVFEGDDLDEVHEKLKEYLTAAGLVEGDSSDDDDDDKPAKKSGKGKKKPKDDDDDDDDDASDSSDDDDDASDSSDDDDDDDGASELRETLKKMVMKHSKTEGGPDKIRKALKKVGASKFGEVPDKKLAAFKSAMAAVGIKK